MNFFQWFIKSMTGYFSRAAPPGPEPPQLPAVAAAPEEQPETITATAKDVQPAPRAASNGWISIHALLAESDSKSAQNSGALLRI